LCVTCGGDASLPYGGHRPYAADPHSNAAPPDRGPGAARGDGRCNLWSAPAVRRSTSGCSTGSQPMRSDPRSPPAAGGATARSGGRNVRWCTVRPVVGTYRTPVHIGTQYPRSRPMRSDPRSPPAAGGATACSGGRCVR